MFPIPRAPVAVSDRGYDNHISAGEVHFVSIVRTDTGSPSSPVQEERTNRKPTWKDLPEAV